MQSTPNAHVHFEWELWVGCERDFEGDFAHGALMVPVLDLKSYYHVVPVRINLD